MKNVAKSINDSNKEQKRAYRKEIRIMPDAECRRFFGAVNQLKIQKIGEKSKYNQLTKCHGNEISPGAHLGHAFLPFHRELLKQ